MHRDRDYRETDFGGEGEAPAHRPVFNVSHLDHTTCLHMNGPALDLLLDYLDIDLGEVKDATARAMFHNLFNAADGRAPRRAG